MSGNTASFFTRTAEKLKSLGSSLVNILFFSLADEHIAPGQCLSVHLDSGEIAVAYGSRFLSRIKIRGIRRYPLGEGEYPSPEALASTVHLAINDLGAAKADITLIVPKAWTIMKKADFPLVVKENFSDVLRFELDRLTPLSPEKAYYDYQIIGEDEDRLQIILVALKAETLDPYLHALRQKGMQVKKVIVNLSALGALSRRVHGGDATAFLDIRPAGYEGGLIESGRLTAFFGERFFSEDAPERTRIIASAINPLLEALKKENKSPLVYIDAKACPTPLLPEQIHAPIRFFEGADLKLRFLHREKAIPSTALGGVLASLGTTLTGLNMLDKGIHEKARRPLAVTICLVIALAAVGLFSLVASLQTETKKAEAVERAIEVREKEVRQVEALQKDTAVLAKELNTIERFKTARPMVLTLVKELTRVLPKSAWLARVHITDDGVGIEGYANTSATDLLQRLEASPYFKKVEFSSPTFRDIKMSADRFAIKMEIEGLAEEKNAKK